MPSFDEIYEEHVWRVYGFIAYRVRSREDAEDLTSQTFERTPSRISGSRRSSLPQGRRS